MCASYNSIIILIPLKLRITQRVLTVMCRIAYIYIRCIRILKYACATNYKNFFVAFSRKSFVLVTRVIFMFPHFWKRKKCVKNDKKNLKFYCVNVFFPNLWKLIYSILNNTHFTLSKFCTAHIRIYVSCTQYIIWSAPHL